jgi:hypothetical protein
MVLGCPRIHVAGRPITGASYIREKWLPVPRAMMPVREELVREGLIRVSGDRRYDYASTRFHGLKPPADMNIIAADDIKTVDYWVEHIDKDHTAASISGKSHDYAWEIAEMGEELPYHAIFATRMRQPDNEELDWARRRAKELNLPWRALSVKKTPHGGP